MWGDPSFTSKGAGGPHPQGEPCVCTPSHSLPRVWDSLSGGSLSIGFWLVNITIVTSSTRIWNGYFGRTELPRYIKKNRERPAESTSPWRWKNSLESCASSPRVPAALPAVKTRALDFHLGRCANTCSSPATAGCLPYFGETRAPTP